MISPGRGNDRRSICTIAPTSRPIRASIARRCDGVRGANRPNQYERHRRRAKSDKATSANSTPRSFVKSKHPCFFSRFYFEAHAATEICSPPRAPRSLISKKRQNSHAESNRSADTTTNMTPREIVDVEFSLR